MSECLSSIAEDFPLIEPDNINPNEIDGSLNDYLIKILKSIGYDEKYIFQDIEVDTPPHTYEPTDVTLREPLNIPVYVATSPDSLPHIVGGWKSVLDSAPVGSPDGHILYELMRVNYEVVEPEYTVILTPFDVYLYRQTSVNPIKEENEYYSLHDWDSELENRLTDKLSPPEYL
jgi:hypothetical protein